jgi:signal transduction histidine kinase
MRSTYGLKIALHCAPGIEPVDFVIRSLCFNAIREVLMNVVKYAGTEHVSIDLEAEDGDLLRVVVEDKGAGFDDQTRQHGSGLDNIQRRLEMVGGSLNIHSEIGVGTVVTLRAPLGVAPNHQPMEDGGRHGIQFFRPTADSHSLKFVSNIGKQGG